MRRSRAGVDRRAPDAPHGGDDPLDELRDVRRQHRGIRSLRVDRRPHCTAFVVAEHHDKRHTEHADGVLERADDGVGDDLTRVAHHEQVTDVPRSKMISAARRESLQPNRAACGACTSARSSRAARRPAGDAAGTPATKRSLPSAISRHASAKGSVHASSGHPCRGDAGREHLELVVRGRAVQHDDAAVELVRRARRRSCPGRERRGGRTRSTRRAPVADAAGRGPAVDRRRQPGRVRVGVDTDALIEPDELGGAGARSRPPRCAPRPQRRDPRIVRVPVGRDDRRCEQRYRLVGVGGDRDVVDRRASCCRRAARRRRSRKATMPSEATVAMHQVEHRSGSSGAGARPPPCGRRSPAASRGGRARRRSGGASGSFDGAGGLRRALLVRVAAFRGVQSRLRADQPLLAALSQCLAALPRGRGDSSSVAVPCSSSFTTRMSSSRACS